MSSEKVVSNFRGTLPVGPYKVEYQNDIGSSDEVYWEWWEVAGIKFDTEKKASMFLSVLGSVSFRNL